MGAIGRYCDKTAVKLNNESRNLVSIVILPKKIIFWFALPQVFHI